MKISDPELEAAMLQLLSVCRAKNIAITGIVEDHGNMNSFSSKVDFQNKRACDVNTFISLKGNIDHFLIEMSKKNETFFEETDKHALAVLATNPQIATTKH